MKAFLARLFKRKSPYASGGVVQKENDCGKIPVIISPARYTVMLPGETAVQVNKRLLYGDKEDFVFSTHEELIEAIKAQEKIK